MKQDSTAWTRQQTLRGLELAMKDLKIEMRNPAYTNFHISYVPRHQTPTTPPKWVDSITLSINYEYESLGNNSHQSKLFGYTRRVKGEKWTRKEK